MSLRDEDARALRDAGFLPMEIEGYRGFDDPEQKPINLDSPIWQAVISSRRDWKNSRIAEGWTIAEIEFKIGEYYARDTKASPWDFIKREYKPLKRIKYLEAVRRRAAARTAGLYRH